MNQEQYLAFDSKTARRSSIFKSVGALMFFAAFLYSIFTMGAMEKKKFLLDTQIKSAKKEISVINGNKTKLLAEIDQLTSKQIDIQNRVVATEKIVGMAVKVNAEAVRAANASDTTISEHTDVKKLLNENKGILASAAMEIGLAKSDTIDARAKLVQVKGKVPKTKNRIYIYIFHELQRRIAKKMADRFESSGTPVIGIQNVEGKGIIPEKTEVRYFTPSDEVSSGKVVSQITDLGCQAQLSLNSDPTVQSGHIEVWFGLDVCTK